MKPLGALAVWADGEAYFDTLPLRNASTIDLPDEATMLKVAHLYRRGADDHPYDAQARILLGGVLLNLGALHIGRRDWDASVAALSDAGESYELAERWMRTTTPWPWIHIRLSAVEHNVALLCWLFGEMSQAANFARRGLERLAPLRPGDDDDARDLVLVSSALRALEFHVPNH